MRFACALWLVAPALMAFVGAGAARADLRALAVAQDWFWTFPGHAPAQREATQQVERFILFAGADLWRNGAFLHGGGLWAPAGLGRDGFVVKAMSTAGLYRYQAGALGGAAVTGHMLAATIMPGVHFTRGGVAVTLFAGFDEQVHRLVPADPGNALRGRRRGLRVAGDLWFEPDATHMLAVSATVSSIGASYGLRAAFGWRLADRVYLGPEAIVYGTDSYRQLRLGMHLTDLTVDLLGWRTQWQAAWGYATASDRAAGFYARLGVSQRH